MLSLLPSGRLREILCLGAHSDDIEIGCGATIRHLVSQHPDTTVRWVVLSAGGERSAEAAASAASWLGGAGSTEILIETFRDRYLPWQGEALKTWLGDLADRCRPDLVLTHSREDMHQDHRTVGELTWSAFRDHMVLEYEVPKWDGDLGRPNLYVPVERAVCERKVEGIMSGFPSQGGRDWFTAETFWALLRLRGIECRSPSGYAEAFHARKMVFA